MTSGVYSMDLLEHSEAIAARDNGLSLVEKNSGKWSLVALTHFKRLPNKIEATGEDIKVWLISGGLPEPHHHNAWGAFIMGLVRSNLLVSTGQTRQMKTRKSHARRNPVYLINK